MKKIVLINPPWYFESPQGILLSQNLGIGYLAACLERAGHTVTVIDALAQGIHCLKKIRDRHGAYYQVGLDYGSIIEAIPQDADFCGISAPFTNHARIIAELSSAIKDRLPRMPIILGGVYPSLLPQSALSCPIDYCVIGEGERAIVDIVAGRNSVKGVLVAGGDTGRLQHAQIIENLDDIPFPAREKLPMEQYLSFRSPRGQRMRSAAVISSRGCPFDCEFCSIRYITGNAWRARSAGNVLEEIRSLIDLYNIEHIEFEDDNLTLDKTRAMLIFEGIEKICRQRKGITWSTPNGIKVDTLDEELLVMMKRSRCISLSIAIESGDPEILARMKKNVDLKKAREIAGACKQLGINVAAFFMIGYPGETEDSFLTTLSYVRELKEAGVNVFYYSIVRAYPGTRLFEKCREQGYIGAQGQTEDLFLGNTITPSNIIASPGIDQATLAHRALQFEKATVPAYLRFYHRHYPLIKKLIPDTVIQGIKSRIDK